MIVNKAKRLKGCEDPRIAEPTEMNEHRDVLSEFAHLKQVAVQVAELITSVRPYLNLMPMERGGLEIEARLGKIKSKSFNTDIGQGPFCTILQLLESYPRWSRVSNWQEVQDVFYQVELPEPYKTDNPSETKTRIRTTVGVDSNGDIEIIHQTKKRLKTVDMEMRVMDAGSCSMSMSRDAQSEGFDARIVANFEEPVPASVLPIAVCPELVRIKQRKRFFLSSLGVANETFSFDMSIVYAGKTKSEAEQNQAAQRDANFEVEIECLNPKEYLKSSGGEDIMLALSLILKCHDFSSALHASSTVTYVPVER